MSYLFEPTSPTCLPILDSDKKFPVRRIYCVGRNYADHAREMGHDPDREPPFFFQKNPDNIIIDNVDFPYPDQSQNVHHEIELVIALHKGGKNLTIDESHDAIFGYAVGLDMTRRDLQKTAKEMGRPWEIGKAFEHSAPCSAITPKDNAPNIATASIWLDVNGERRQSGKINQLIWNIEETISYLSGLFEIKAGDIIMTGTPAGVSAVSRGDILRGHIDGLEDLHCKVV